MVCNEHIVERQYAAAIGLVNEHYETRRKRCAMARESTETPRKSLDHDVVRSMHFVVLLRGRRPVGGVFTNAINVCDAFRGPKWTQAGDSCADRSIHAEARAAHRVFVPDSVSSKRARRKAMRQSVGPADGMLVCRLTVGGRLRYSLPCAKCVQVLARCNFQFVVYSTGDEHAPWHKISVSRLALDERVMPVRRLRS